MDRASQVLYRWFFLKIRFTIINFQSNVSFSFSTPKCNLKQWAWFTFYFVKYIILLLLKISFFVCDIQFARLYKSANDYDVTKGIFNKNEKIHKVTRMGLNYESNRMYKEARKLYHKVSFALNFIAITSFWKLEKFGTKLFLFVSL